MQSTIFTKIINGEVPCHKIYEDELTLAFLDIRPVQPGHTLVIPKEQIDHFEDLPDDIYQAVWATVKKVARKQMAVLSRQRIAVSIMGNDVPHAHVHLIPFDKSQDIHAQPVGTGAIANNKVLAEMAKKLKIGSQND